NPPDGVNPLTGTVLTAYQPGGSAYAVGFDVTFTFQSVSLLIAANTPLAIDAVNFAFTFAQQSGPKISLTADFGGLPIYGDGSGITSNLTLPLGGNLAGCLQFQLQLTPAAQTNLDVGLRYFYAVPPNLHEPDAAPEDGSFSLASLRYPIFNQALTLYANLDPLAPLQPARCFFAFNAADAGQTGDAAATLQTFFNATLGDAFALQPLTGSAAPTAFASLVFAIKQQSSAPTVRDPFYLVPRGDFALQTTRSGTVDLMCGLSGVEYIELGETANVISFFPGNNAFAEGFFPGQKPGFTNLQPSVAPTTSFAAVTQTSGSLDYYAQPDQSVLYNYNSQKISGVTIPALAAVPVLAGTISQPPASSLTYPLLPYSGLNGLKSDLLAAYRQLESQIISPERRTALLAAPPVAQQGRSSLPSTYSATPQGLLAAYSPSTPTVWEQIILAKMQATPAQFLLSNVQGNLLSAFQSNKLFLVVSLPSAIQSSLFGANAQISIGDDPSELWNFNLDPTPNAQTGGQSPWTTYDTIFIVKFSDLSISELAGQTSTWAFADYFNTSPDATSQTIAEIISDAAAASDPDFATFLNAVNNPNWNGILALNAMAPLSSLPPQLAGLAAGIDPDLFFAHHIGINASKINVPTSPGDLSISESSIFGLINYEAPGPLAPSGADYQYQVEQLKVLFLNSAVASFSSIIDLQVNNLFGETAKLAGSADNIVQMYGVYQQHVVNGQTLDSYLFQTASGEVSNFYLKSNVLNAVQFSKGQFITLRPQPINIATNGVARTNAVTAVTTVAPHQLNAGDSVNLSGVTDNSFNGLFTVASVPDATTFTYAQADQPNASSSGGEILATKTDAEFVFWGTMDFKSLPGFDLFSFGRPTSFIETAANKGAVRSSGVTTITTTAPHGLGVGQRAQIYGVADSSFNGIFTITAVPSATSFTYEQQALPDGSSGNGAATPDEVQGLGFGNLLIELSFDSAATPVAPVFAFDASQLSFDMASSESRAGSFFTNFPLTVAGFTQAKQGTSPTGAGYMGLQSPLTLGALTYPWYSLNFNLNLGSPGALAAEVGFIAGLTAAWSPGGNTYKVFTGLKLPGSTGSKREISIEGIFKITFKTLEILVQENNQYILVLYNIGFKFLAFTFPPSGQVNFVLFGDPNGAANGSNSSLGWYAAYAKPETKKQGQKQSQAALPAASSKS
ncbi:MAG TPA: hypothetical protein PKD31_22520, partial [Blastocatellia bacterium]|nr:hypothetical protein [Blastocatellia bacterium]